MRNFNFILLMTKDYWNTVLENTNQRLMVFVVFFTTLWEKAEDDLQITKLLRQDNLKGIKVFFKFEL